MSRLRKNRTARIQKFSSFLVSLVFVAQLVVSNTSLKRVLPRLLREIRRSSIDWDELAIDASLYPDSNVYIEPPRIHIISLRRTPDRLLTLLKELRQQQVSYEISPAVDGFEDFDIEEVMLYAGRKKMKKLNTSLAFFSQPDTLREGDRHERLRFGCYLSHVHLWKYLVENRLPYLMIFEDDAVLKNGFSTALKRSILSLPLSWDVFYLNSCYTKLGMSVRQNIRQVKGALCTNGYVISSRGAQKLLQKSVLHSEKPIDHMLDEAIYTNRILAFHADPPLISVRDAPSTLSYV